MNKEQYKKLLEAKRERVLRLIEDRERSQRASLIQYESATLDGYKDVILEDPEITLKDYDDLIAVIDSVDRDIWNWRKAKF